MSMWLSVITAITNNKGDRDLLEIYLSGTLLQQSFFSPSVNSTPQVSMVFSIKFMTSSDIWYILWQFIIQDGGNHIENLFLVNLHHC